MSMLPEYALAAFLADGIALLRGRELYVREVLSEMRREDQDAVLGRLRTTQVQISIGAPVKPVSPPAFVLFMRGETPLAPVLGDHQGFQPPPATSYADQPAGVSSDSVLAIDEVDGDCVLTATAASGGSRQYIDASGARLVPGALVGKVLRVLLGPGRGSVEVIADNTPDRITPARPLRDVPTTATVFEVREPPARLRGAEPVPVVAREQGGVEYEILGQRFRKSFQLQCIDTDPSMTLAWACLVKAMLWLVRQPMEGAGFGAMAATMTDLLNREDYVPDEAHVRGVDVGFDWLDFVAAQREVPTHLGVELSFLVPGASKTASVAAPPIMLVEPAAIVD